MCSLLEHLSTVTEEEIAAERERMISEGLLVEVETKFGTISFYRDSENAESTNELIMGLT